MTEQALYSDGLRNKASKSPMSASTPIAKVSSLTPKLATQIIELIRSEGTHLDIV